MRFSAWAILGISAIGIGFGFFWILVNVSIGCWEGGVLYGAPFLLLGAFGASFLYAKRKSFDESDASVWAALLVYAAFGLCWIFWAIFTQVAGFGTT